MAESTLTPEDRAAALAFLAASQAKGGSPASAAPATQKFLAHWNEDTKSFDFYANDNYQAPKLTPPTPVTGSPYGNWAPDPNNPSGPWIQTVPPQIGIPPNPDEDQLKAINAQVAGAKRDELLRNQAAGNGFLTDEQVATEARLKGDQSISSGTLALNRQKWEQDNRRADAEAQRAAATTTANIAKTGAETTQIGAATDFTRAQIAALDIKTSSDADRAHQAGLLDQAQTDKIKFELTQPQPVATPLDQQFLVRRDQQTGQQVVDTNPNYQGPKAPTSRSEIAQRVALLQTQAAQMKDKISADASIPKDQQSARFLSWWDQQVAPQVGALEQQYQFVAKDEAQKASEAQRANLATAASAFQGTAPYRVGPGYGKAFENIVQATARGETAKGVDLTGAATFKGPDLDTHIQNLLSGVSPAAAAATGGPMPNYGGMDIRGQLNANNWFPGGPPPDAGPGGPPVDTSGGPPPGVVPPGIPPQVPPQGPPWQRADQWATQMPTGGPPIPPPGLTGTVPWGDPRYVGMTPSRPAPAAWSQAMPNFGNPQLINPYTFPG